MTSSCTSSLLTFLIFSYIFLTHSASSSAFDCGTGVGCSYDHNKEAHYQNINYNRKMVVGSSSSRLSRVGVDEGKVNDEMEMRRSVPSGPDPLHHNSGPLKKPRISP